MTPHVLQIEKVVNDQVLPVDKQPIVSQLRKQAKQTQVRSHAEQLKKSPPAHMTAPSPAKQPAFQAVLTKAGLPPYDLCRNLQLQGS